MNQEINKIKSRLESQINSLNVPAGQKDRMQRSLEAIFMAPNGRLYLQRNPDFQSYITIAKDNFTNGYDLCLVRRMINEQSGAIEGKESQFPRIIRNI